MFGRAIWDKLPECIFENAGVKRNFKIFKNHEGNLSQKSPEPNMWFTGQSHHTNKHFVLKLKYFNSGQLQISGQLQNNSVNGEILITLTV